MEREIMATFRAATMRPDFLTADKLDAGLGGWGAFNIGIWAAADVIAKEMKKGRKLKLEATDEASTDVDEIAQKAVRTLRECGADPANAALCAAVLLYWAGVNIQCGMPCPNRKLGAVTRMAAGITSGRVSSIPTEKQNNKISGFAATLAIYQALDKEHLAPYDSRFLPLGSGGPITGHSCIGEDHLFPKLGQKLAAIGTKAMMRAYLSAGMRPNKWLSALFGATAALEIIHPDAYVGEEFGLKLTKTPETVADAAVKEAELPEKIHIRGVGDEFRTSRIVGDLAIILKDSGTPTVVGMIMFCELCSIILEGGTFGAGRAGGPLLVPLHHWVTSPVLGLYMMGKGASHDEIVGVIRKTLNLYFQPEDAMVAANVLARKADSVERGPLSDAVIRATEPTLVNALSRRAIYAHQRMKVEGASLEELVQEVQTRNIDKIAAAVARSMTKRLGRNIEYIRFTTVRPGSGRRTHTFLQKHFAFDAYVDVEVKIDGQVFVLENVLAKAAPEALLNCDRETMDAVSSVTLAIIDLLCGGASTLDVTVCACMAAALGMEPKEAADRTAKAANVILAIPSPSLRKAAQAATEIMKGLDF